MTRLSAYIETDGWKHQWRGCKPFLKNHPDEQVVICTHCGKSNKYEQKIIYPWVQGYSGWKEGIRPALFPMSLILILFCLMLFLTVEWHRMN